MRHFLRVSLIFLAVSLFSVSLPAQTKTGAIDLSVHITPTGAQPEPVRNFSFYVLTKSYRDIVKEVDADDVLPAREQFIDKLTCSPELKAWLKAHDQDHGIADLSSTDLDKLLTVDDIMNVPEFFSAFERSNGGGVTKGLPMPKYRDSDKEANPERYQRQKDEFLAATRKFIETHPATVQGIELELTAINPKTAWDNMHLEHNRKVAQTAPDTAQVQYLAGKVVTNLDGRALLTGLAPGNYWVSTLGMDATSGDRRLTWDVPVSVQPGAPTRVDLSNLNGTAPPRRTIH